MQSYLIFFLLANITNLVTLYPSSNATSRDIIHNIDGQAIDVQDINSTVIYYLQTLFFNAEIKTIYANE